MTFLIFLVRCPNNCLFFFNTRLFVGIEKRMELLRQKSIDSMNGKALPYVLPTLEEVWCMFKNR